MNDIDNVLSEDFKECQVKDGFNQGIDGQLSILFESVADTSVLDYDTIDQTTVLCSGIEHLCYEVSTDQPLV